MGGGGAAAAVPAPARRSVPYCSARDCSLSWALAPHPESRNPHGAPGTPRSAPRAEQPHPRCRACSSGGSGSRRGGIWAGTTPTSPPCLTRTRKVREQGAPPLRAAFGPRPGPPFLSALCPGPRRGASTLAAPACRGPRGGWQVRGLEPKAFAGGQKGGVACGGESGSAWARVRGKPGLPQSPRLKAAWARVSTMRAPRAAPLPCRRQPHRPGQPRETFSWLNSVAPRKASRWRRGGAGCHAVS